MPTKCKPKLRPRLALLLMAVLLILPTGCAKKVSSACPAPAIVEYSRDFNQALADQIERICTDPATAQACRALKDCFVTRAQIKACGKRALSP